MALIGEFLYIYVAFCVDTYIHVVCFNLEVDYCSLLKKDISSLSTNCHSTQDISKSGYNKVIC